MTQLPASPHDDTHAAVWQQTCRRSFLRLTAAGLGSVALASLVDPKLLAAPASGRWRGVLLYGCKPGDGSFAANCLLARRLAERGVRFIQLYHKDGDHHGGVKAGVEFKAQEVDRACAGLIRDLKQRDMLKDTLIVWAGKFGRTPMSQGGDGRDIKAPLASNAARYLLAKRSLSLCIARRGTS